MIEVKDTTAGLDVSAACYKYSIDGGSAGGPGFYELYWKRRHTSHQTITAGSVPFNRDSGTQNKIKFKIDDVVGNMGESDEYTVNIDAAYPTAPMISSPTNLDGGVGATEMFKSDWYVWLIATKNGG
ncbi:MAG: hypothetical protein GQ567_04150 [Methanosarcinales archaeon]|nr:hypothetical protein [Methanosarcinales archaeon]